MSHLGAGGHTGSLTASTDSQTALLYSCCATSRKGVALWRFDRGGWPAYVHAGAVTNSILHRGSCFPNFDLGEDVAPTVCALLLVFPLQLFFKQEVPTHCPTMLWKSTERIPDSPLILNLRRRRLKQHHEITGQFRS